MTRIARRCSRLLLRPISLALLGGSVLFMSACATQTVPSPSASAGALGSMAPVLSVERFLQAVNQRDLQTMANLFGNVDGPMPGDRMEVEQRMDLFARILQHVDFNVASESRVAAREYPTIRVGVDLTMSQRVVPDVAFVVVQSRAGGWLIEEIDLAAVTGQ